MKCIPSAARLFVFSVAIALNATSLFAQTPASAGKCQPEEFVQQLWKNAGKGDLLTAEGWRQASAFFLHPAPWSQNKIVRLVAGDWQLSNCTIQGNTAEVTVNFRDAGRLDAALYYTPTKEPEGLETQKRYRFVMAPTHWHTYKPDGSIDKELTGRAEWQIEDVPDSQWTTVNTAIRYILETRNNTSDPSVRANADQALAQLMKIGGAPQSTTANLGRTSPDQVIEQLWTEATNGALLTPAGWKTSSRLFTLPDSAPHGKTVHVIDNDWAINKSAISGNKAKIIVGYSDAGQIDSALKYIPPKPTKFFKIGFQYSLVFVSGDRSPESNGQRVSDKPGQLPKWKILGTPNTFPGTPWTTVNTAIRYVLEKRSETEDPVIKKNAENTLAALLRYR